MKKGLQSETYRAKTQAERFREEIRYVLVGIFLVSIYLTGALDVLLLQLDSGFLLRNVLSALISTRLSLIFLPVIFLTLATIAILTVHKTWEEAQREDSLGRGFLHSKGASPYGSAHFGQPWEFVDAAQIRPVEECKGKILGQLDDKGRQCIDFNPYEGRINSHMVAIGRSGGGKTFTFVKTFMMQAMKEKHSLFIADPKGDLFRETSSYFRDNGYIVRKLDLKNLEKSDGWNCLGSLHGPNLVTNVQVFSQTVMANISEKDDPHSRAAKSLLSALILRVLQGNEYSPEMKTIKTVHELLQDPGRLEFLDSILSEENVTADESACVSFYQDFRRGSDNFLGNVITHLASGVQLLNNPLLSEILSTDDIDLTMAGQVPCVFYILFPDTDETFKFIISLFFSLAFINLVEFADLHTKDGKLPVPVDFLLDEFPALGVIPDWDRKIATVRSRRINCVMIIQDIPQLKKRYAEHYATLLNNCGVILTLGINEPAETAPYLSKRIGETSIEVVSKSESVVADEVKDFSSKQSTGVGKREFLSVAEICEISRDGSLLIFADHQPVYANKFPYILHPDAEKMEDTYAEDIPDFSDKEARAKYREAEAAYLQHFWATNQMHPDMKYSNLSNALFTEPPESPSAMVMDMLRDDFLTAKKTASRFFQVLTHKATPSDDGTRTEETSTANEFKSAEKGAFKRFCEAYMAEEKQEPVRYSDLSIEIGTADGDVLSIDEELQESGTPSPEPAEPVQPQQTIPDPEEERPPSVSNPVTKEKPKQHRPRKLSTEYTDAEVLTAIASKEKN